MIRTIFSLMGLCLWLSTAFAQQKVLTKTGEARFYSKAPLEDIEASNGNVVAVIDFDKSEVAVKMLIKKFEFRKSLMQEHFNENYMESDKYPSATFSGALEGLSAIDLRKDGVHEVKITGEIDIHLIRPLY